MPTEQSAALVRLTTARANLQLVKERSEGNPLKNFLPQLVYYHYYFNHALVRAMPNICKHGNKDLFALQMKRLYAVTSTQAVLTAAASNYRSSGARISTLIRRNVTSGEEPRGNGGGGGGAWESDKSRRRREGCPQNGNAGEGEAGEGDIREDEEEERMPDQVEDAESRPRESDSGVADTSHWGSRNRQTTGPPPAGLRPRSSSRGRDSSVSSARSVVMAPASARPGLGIEHSEHSLNKTQTGRSSSYAVSNPLRNQGGPAG
ncbi:unnamed protein product [Protopolystoma xenopodis]|uniref:Uncharacterized protein n=1 Tax=Protopolystoma xenopodis TaxID=117903 RepID=A0A3S5B8I3_9PLAT|nr:unnamed protein product [Protopolystoma xenopodis]